MWTLERIGLNMLFWQKKINQPTTTTSSSIPLTLVTVSSLILFYTRPGESSVLTEMEKPGKIKNHKISLNTNNTQVSLTNFDQVYIT